MSKDATPKVVQLFGESVQGPEKKNAIQKAYAQYITDDRIDTEEDDEAFMDAIIKNIVLPMENALESTVAHALGV